MAQSGLYSNMAAVAERGAIDPFVPMQAEPEKPQAEQGRSVTGDGLIVMHGTRLDVDISVRISDLINTVNALADRVALLEAILGAGDSAPVDSDIGSSVALGYWRWTVDPATGNLLFQADLDKGTVSPPTRWFTKQENSIDGDEVL